MIGLGIGVPFSRSGGGRTWYVRPSGGSYGDEDGTSYATAWAGFGDIVWGDGGVVAGDTLYVCGTHVEFFTVLNSGTISKAITIRGDYAGDAGILDGADTRDTNFDLNSRDYITISRLTSKDALVNCFQFRGTAKGIITNNLVATGSGNQALQHEDTARVTHNNPYCDDCVDDGISCHDSSSVIVNKGTISNCTDGINCVVNSNCTASDVVFSNNTYDVTVIADTLGSAWIDVTGSTLSGITEAYSEGTIILRNCTVNGAVDIAVRANYGVLEVYDSTINGAMDFGGYSQVTAVDSDLVGTLTIGTDMTSFALTRCTVTSTASFRGTLTATATVFMGAMDAIASTTGTLDSCLVSALDSSLYGNWTMTECHIIGVTSLSNTVVAKRCLFDGDGNTEHVMDTGSAADVTFDYCIFKGMASAKYGVAIRTGSVGSINGCTFVGASGVGAGVYSQVNTTISNCIFTDLSAGINVASSSTIISNNNCFYDNTADTVGIVTESDSQATDPALEDVSSLDFSLGSGSSCIGNGIDLGTSIDGISSADWGDGSTEAPVVTTKQQSASWDIGAYVS